MRRMTLLGQPPPRRPFGKALALSLALGAAGGVVWWTWFRPTPPPPPVAQAPAAPTVPVESPPAEAAPAPQDALRQAGLRAVHVQIDGPLETTLSGSLGREVGPALAQVVTRTLVWWIDVPEGLRRGDKLDVLFEERPGEEPTVHGVRFQSEKAGRSFRAYRFQPSGSTFPRMVEPSGEELELRLDPSPLDDYEQITSLIRDGRRHKGVDFKVPVGAPVRATFAGVITRKNWNWRGNGNCLELTDPASGRRALYLHLFELPKTRRVGDRVAAGEVIARSGNSGRSFAPHLHYQLMLGEERVLDPFAIQRTRRRTLPPEGQAALAAEVQRLDALLTPPVAMK